MYTKLTAAQGAQVWDGVPGMCSAIGELLRVNGVHSIVFDSDIDTGFRTLIDGSVETLSEIPYLEAIDFLWDAWDEDGTIAFLRSGKLCMSVMNNGQDYFTVVQSDFEDDFDMKTSRFIASGKIARVWKQSTNEHVVISSDGALQVMKTPWDKGIEAYAKAAGLGNRTKSRKFHRRIPS